MQLMTLRVATCVVRYSCLFHGRCLATGLHFTILKLVFWDMMHVVW
jgi:hypothetical protein